MESHQIEEAILSAQHALAAWLEAWVAKDWDSLAELTQVMLSGTATTMRAVILTLKLRNLQSYWSPTVKEYMELRDKPGLAWVDFIVEATRPREIFIARVLMDEGKWKVNAISTTRRLPESMRRCETAEQIEAARNPEKTRKEQGNATDGTDPTK